MQRIGEPWRPGRPWQQRIGAYAVITGRDGLLLLVDQDGEVQLPGGGLDPGEGPIAALHREVREETGWRIAAPRRLGAFQRYTWMPEYRIWAHKVQLIYVAEAVLPLPVRLEPGHTPLWAAPDLAARKLDVEGDRAMVRRAIRLGLV